MIKLTDEIWIGDSDDEKEGNFTSEDGEIKNITAILNVASDLVGTQGDDELEYMQVGLVDGPGNPVSAYCGAVLALATLLKRHEQVLVVCHSEYSRTLAVVIIYLIIQNGRVSDHPTFLNCWKTWRRVIGELRKSTGVNLPEPHDAHIEVMETLSYGVLEQLV